MELVVITITDPIRWFERITWIKENSTYFKDQTYWGTWNIGLSDIEVIVDDQTAILYYLTWPT